MSTERYEGMDARTIADSAMVDATSAEAALSHLVGQLVSGELDTSKDADTDALVTFCKGIAARMREVSDACDAIVRSLGRTAPAAAPQTTPTTPYAAVPLDLLDRATDSMYELCLLSEFYRITADHAGGTAERGSAGAAATMCERATNAMGELIDAANEINQRSI